MNATALDLETAASPLIRQDWDAYTAEQHDVWRILYERRMLSLAETGSRVFLDGAEAIGLRRDRVPDLTDISARLAPRTGWAALPVGGFIPAADFFAFLARKQFPTTITIRPREQLDYLPEPDIFHDVFGHVPLHADPVFAAFLQRFGAVAVRARTDEQVQAMARLFWFTVEFGLIREDSAIKVYGSGLISSASDAANALSDNCERRDFDIDSVIQQHFDIDRLQDVLYVVSSFDELFEAVEIMNSRIAN